MSSLNPPKSPAMQATSIGDTEVRPASPDETAPAGSGRRGRLAGRYPAWALSLRQNWLAAALLTAGLVLRVLAELAYRPALFYIDTVRYLYNAGGMDPVGYKGPLRAILLVGNFDAVAAFQHLLGLAMAVVIYLLLRRRGVARWLAALAIAPVLLDGYQLQIEQTIMPDTLFEAMIVAGLAILLWSPRPGWRRVVCAGVVLGASATVAQVGEALLLPAVIYLVAVGGGWRRVLGRAVTMAVAFAAPIVVYCTVSYLVAGAPFLSHTGVTSFYGRMAAAADCATLRLPAAERGLCPTPAQQAQGPDWLEYNAASPVRPYYANLPRGETDSMLSNFNHSVLTQQPGRVLGAYASNVVELFALTRDGRAGDTLIARWQFQAKFPYYPPHASMAVIDTAVGRYGGGRPAVWAPVAAFLRSYQLDGGYTPGPLMAVFVLVGLGGSVLLLRRRAGPAARELSLACLLLFTAGAAVTLVSDLFEFSWRYQLPVLVTLVPAGALGIGVIIGSLRGVAEPGGAEPGGAKSRGE
jgi:hypothetical protein